MRERAAHPTHEFNEGEIVRCNGVPALVVEWIEGDLPYYWVRFDSGRVARVTEEELMPL